MGESSHRQFTVGDNTRTSVSVTLWGKAAETTRDWPVGGIVALKGVKLGDFGGISLSGGAQTGLELMPDLQEAVQLKTWLDSPEGLNCSYHPLTSGRGPRRDAGDGHGGQNANVQNQPAKWLTFAEANKITDPAACQPFWAYATVQGIKHDANSQWTYPACPKCNKKMVQQAGGGADGWECHNEKCRYQGAPQRRYTLQVSLLDHTGIVYTTAFSDTGEKFLKSTAPDLYALHEAGQMTPLEHRFQDALMRTWKVKLQPKFETYMERQKLKIGLVEAEPVDFAESTKFLLDRLTILENS